MESSTNSSDPLQSPESSSLETDLSTNGNQGSQAQPTSSTPPPWPAPGPVKSSFFKRLWQRFNIYMLLFVLVILLAGGIIIVFILKDKNPTPSITNSGSQSLTSAQLQQLANTDTTVGTPKQTLTVQSNAVFAGTMLVRQDLEVAGTIRVNGALALPGITVSGLSTFNQIQTSSLGVTGNETVQGSLTAKNGIVAIGNSTFSGNVSATQLTTNTLQLNGDLILTHHVTGGGAIPALSEGVALGGGGTASVSGSDTSGSLTINTGSTPGAGCFATITFARQYSSTPHVIITPVGAGAASVSYYINRSSSSFSVCTTTPAPASQTFGFDYIIMN